MKKFLLLLVALFISNTAQAAILVMSQNGTYTTKTTLEAARTAADTAGKTVVVTSALTQAQSNITAAWPSDRALEIKQGGSVNPTTAFTADGVVIVSGGTFGGTGSIVINGPFNPGFYHVFTGTGAVTGLTNVDASWFGVLPSTAAADNPTRFRRAITAGTHISISLPGTYASDAEVSLTPLDNNKTIIINDGAIWSVNGTSAAFSVNGVRDAITTLATDEAIGSTSIEVASATGFAIGKKIWIYPTTGVGTGQVDVAVISNISGATITLDKGLNTAWTALDGISVACVTPVERVFFTGNGRVENLTASNSDNLIGFFWAWDCHIDKLSVAQRQGTSRPVLFSSSTGPRGTAFCSADKVIVTESSEHGIESYVLSYGNKITHNIIEKAGTGIIGHGIAVRGSKHIIGDNIVKSAKEDGINVGTARDVIISNNNISGATSAGSAGLAVSTSTVQGVILTGNTSAGNGFGARFYDGTPSGTERIVLIGNNLRGNMTGPINAAAGMEIYASANTPGNAKYLLQSVATSGTDEDSLYSTTIPKYTLGQNGGINIKARFYVTGSAGTKTLRVKLGAVTIMASVLQAAESGSHTIEISILNNGTYTGQNSSWLSFTSTIGIETHDRNAIALDTTTDLTFQITGQCSNAGDTAVLERLDITPIGVAL